MYTLEPPFTGSPRKLADLPLRFGGVTWGNEHLALVEEFRWKDRKRSILAIDPTRAGQPATLFDGSFEDRYHDPGRPMLQANKAGKDVLITTPDGIYFSGDGASPDGDRPFVAVMNSRNGENKQLWRSEAPFYAWPVAILDPARPAVLINRQSQEQSKRQSNRRLGRSRTPAYTVSMGVVSAVEWIPVESGLFSSAAYRAGIRQLYLRFQDGKIYRFFDCPVTVYTEFVAAASKGRYFSQQIRNHFRYEMVRRGNSGNRHCGSPQPCLAEQLKASVVLAKARAVPQRDMTEAAGAQEGAGFNGYAQPKPLE